EPLDGDAEHVAGRRAWPREPGSRSHVHLREPPEQLGRTALLDAGSAVDDEILLQPHPVSPLRRNRERDPRVALDVAHLLAPRQRPDDYLIALQPDPDAGHLRAAVAVERD